MANTHGAPIDGAISLPRPDRRADLRGPSLQELDTGDAALGGVLDKVTRVAGRDIAILITGETGTGKELLARAIHRDSARARGHFCAVNCAAIPEALIESELFGYDEGAFTGARKKGSRGKILQADGGTLFLDEIGDMPPSLQARLLRVLQEREVTPLGAARPVAVDIALVCATNRNLRELIAQNLFREDLYYRLNGLVVRLPPLRQRSDLETLVHAFLAAADGALEAGAAAAAGAGPAVATSPGTGAQAARSSMRATHFCVSAQAMALLRRHPWPGNLRQLANLLRTACAMVGADGRIGVEHLPEDFLDDLEPGAAEAGCGHAGAPCICSMSQKALGVQPKACCSVRPTGLPHATAPLQVDGHGNADIGPGANAAQGAGADAATKVSRNVNAETGAGAQFNGAAPSRQAASMPALDMRQSRALLIQRTLAAFNGNISATARALGISRNTVYRQRSH